MIRETPDELEYWIIVGWSCVSCFFFFSAFKKKVLWEGKKGRGAGAGKAWEDVAAELKRRRVEREKRERRIEGLEPEPCIPQ